MVNYFITKTYAATLPDGIIGLVKNSCGGDCTNANLDTVITLLKNVITQAGAFAGIFALIMFLYGAFNYTTSAGNEEKVKKATGTMIWSIIGLVIIALSYTIITISASLFK